MILNVQKTVEVSQIQNVDKIVDAPVVVAQQPTPVDAEAIHRLNPLNGLRTSQSGRSLSPGRARSPWRPSLLEVLTRCQAQRTVSSKGRNAGLKLTRHVRGARQRKGTVEEGKGLDLLLVTTNLEAGPATTVEERNVDWTQDMRENCRMVEFLVRWERKLDVKADVAVRRLEKERSQPVKLVVDKWFVDTGFGFGKVPTGEVVFIHASVVRGAEVLTIGTDAWVQVAHSDARGQGREVSSM